MMSLRDGEDGSALIMALAFILVWSLVIFAVLDLTVIATEISAGAQQRTDRVYAADAAFETVVAAIANDPDPSAGACPEPTLQFDGVDVTISCELYTGPNVRVADLEAFVDGDPWLRARVRFDDTQQPAEVNVVNWMVLR